MRVTVDVKEARTDSELILLAQLMGRQMQHLE
jgi:hypothetical protein